MSEIPNTNKKELKVVSQQETTNKKNMKVANDMQEALAKLFRPEIEGKKDFSQALIELIPIHGVNFRHIVDMDALLHPNNKLTDLWCENRGRDDHRVLPFIKSVLETMRSLDNLVESTQDEKEKGILKRKRNERLEKLLKERVDVL
ncbi:MAG: hypothetical protein HY225_02740 [Candidatus Vogelbacteria bacterium]|nr:hypothetical protein [Candidatus Vogelbacteria bacterium]